MPFLLMFYNNTCHDRGLDPAMALASSLSYGIAYHQHTAEVCISSPNVR